MSDNSLYTRLLLPKRHGYPISCPTPYGDAPLEARQIGTEIGDVGVVMSDGSFDVIFNICRASDDPINRFGVPRGFEQVHVGPEAVASLPEFHDPGSHVSNATINKRRLGVDASAESNVFLPLGAGAVVEISTSSKEAAVLLLPNGASRANLRPLKEFRDYAIKHAQRWYEFVNGNLGRMVENGDLYLVTGMDKTSSWSIAAAENQSENSRISLKLKAAQVGAMQASYIWEWEAASSFAASGPRRPPAEESWGQNQTVFLRGYKVAIRSRPLKKSPKAISIVDSKPSDILSKSRFIPYSKSPNNSNSFFRGASTSGQGSASDDVGSPPSSDSSGTPDSSGAPDKEESVKYFPQSAKLYHPGYAINEYLLGSTPDAMVAVTHDNDWMLLLNEDDEEIPEDYELIRRISHTYTIENIADGVWLEHIDSGTNGDKDEDSKTVQVVYPQVAHHDGGKLYPAVPADTETRVVYTSASFMPASLHPYLNSSPATSRSSQDITAHPITQESYSLHSLSIQHLPATLSVQQPPAATLSVQHLPVLPPSPNLGPGGYLPSTNSSIVDFHLAGPATESPSQSRRSSVHGDTPVACLNDAHPRIFPVAPENVQRYTRKTTIPNDPTVFQLKPLTISVTANPPPAGWTRCQHPEGAQYFFHEEKRVFTDANLFDNASLMFIHENIRLVHDFLRAHSVHLPPGVDLVLDEYVYDDGSKGCQYYFVNHLDRCVFWMDHGHSDLFPVAHVVKGMTSASHIRHELEAQYWLHCEYYPTAFEVTHEIIDELRDIVLHALGDVITSPTSTVSWKVDDLKNMITLIDGCAKNVGKHSHKTFSGSSCLVARLMHGFARHRVYNFHGEPGARLNVDQSVHPIIKKRMALIKIIRKLARLLPAHVKGLGKTEQARLAQLKDTTESISSSGTGA